MEKVFLNDQWQIENQKQESVLFIRIMLAFLTIAITFCLFWIVALNISLIDESKSKVWLKAENTRLKQEIESVNERLINEYDITDRVIKMSK